MSFLLDTRYISELMKPRPNPGVFEWSVVQRKLTVVSYVSSLTIGEVEFGIMRLPKSARRDDLEGWLADVLLPQFDGRVLPVDIDIARRWGRLASQCQRTGMTMPIVDGLIAATALHWNLSVVTNNIRDFAGAGVEVVCPWTDS